jgi:Kazal-type serine protease inhibitor domain
MSGLRGRVATLRLAACGLGAALLLSCAPVDVVIAELPEVDAGASDGDCADGNCHNDNCPMPDCRVPGACQPRPDTCDTDIEPVCGCDGITYWNDCLRLQNGVPTSTWDVCHGAAITCDTDDDCGPGASCARLFSYGDRCEHRRGTCWVLPSSCPPFDPDGWVPCGHPYDNCVDTCRAIRSGDPHRHQFQCP